MGLNVMYVSNVFCFVKVKVNLNLNLNLNVIAIKTVIELVVVVMSAIVKRSLSLFQNFFGVLT